MDMRNYEVLSPDYDGTRQLWCNRCQREVATTDGGMLGLVAALPDDVSLADLLRAATGHDQVHRAEPKPLTPGMLMHTRFE